MVHLPLRRHLCGASFPIDRSIAMECVSGIKAMADNPIPLVIVEGFLASASAAMGCKGSE